MKKLNKSIKGITEIIKLYAECKMGKRGMVHFVSMAETKAIFGASKIECRMIDIMYDDLRKQNIPYMVITHG